MKKRILTIILSAAMLLGAFSLSACANSELEAKIAELETQIAKLEGENKRLKNYLIEKGGFCSLDDAYTFDLITKEDLMSIAYYNNNGRKYNEEIMPEDYKPLPKNPEALSEETELKIKQAFWDENYESGRLNNCTIDSLGVEYFGTYNDCSAVMIWCSDWGYEQMVRELIIDDVLIFYPNLNTIRIWIEAK